MQGLHHWMLLPHAVFINLSLLLLFLPAMGIKIETRTTSFHCSTPPLKGLVSTIQRFCENSNMAKLLFGIFAVAASLVVGKLTKSPLNPYSTLKYVKCQCKVLSEVVFLKLNLDWLYLAECWLQGTTFFLKPERIQVCLMPLQSVAQSKAFLQKVIRCGGDVWDVLHFKLLVTNLFKHRLYYTASRQHKNEDLLLKQWWFRKPLDGTD